MEADHGLHAWSERRREEARSSDFGVQEREPWGQGELLQVLTMTAYSLSRLAALLGVLLLAEPACADGVRSATPTCLAGVCVGEKAPTEHALKQRFGGKSFDLGFRTRGYCYEVAAREKKTAHLLFALKNFGDGWRVVSIRASESPICTAATPLKRAIDLKTSEGLLLGESVARVHAVYGAATHTLEATSKVVAEIMLSKTQGLTSALQYVPADPSLALSALFVVANDRVVAIQVSSDV
jgi:hypothetical protein